MEAAGGGPVAEVAQGDRLLAQLRPWNLVKVAVQGQGVRHQLQPVVQGTVMLDVEKFRVPIGYLQQRAGIALYLTAPVDLQLHAKKPGPLSAEDGLRFIVVVMDWIVFAPLLVAVHAVGVLVVIVVLGVVGAGLVQQRPAAAAVGVVVVKAALAQGCVRTASVVLVPDALPTAFTGQGSLVQAVWTELQAVKGIQFFSWIGLTAQSAGSLFAHSHYLHDFSPRSPRGHSWR